MPDTLPYFRSGKLGDEFAKIFLELAERDSVNLQSLHNLVLRLNMAGMVLDSLSELYNVFDPKTGRVKIALTEFDGDVTAHGGDVNANMNSTTADARFNVQTQQVTRGALWYDQSEGNIVVENDGSAKPIVLNVDDGTINFYDEDDDEDVFIADASGHGFQLLKTSVEPAYVDGYAILYFYSDGAGSDLLKVRGKIGATETAVTLANLSP